MYFSNEKEKLSIFESNKVINGEVVYVCFSKKYIIIYILYIIQDKINLYNEKFIYIFMGAICSFKGVIFLVTLPYYFIYT